MNIINSNKQNIHINKKYKQNKISAVLFSPISQIKSNVYNVSEMKLGVSSDFILIIIILISIMTGIIGYLIINNILFGIVCFIFSFKLIQYILNKVKKRKLKNLYNQIEKLIDLCEKDNYVNITDYFGQIYINFDGELRNNLEKCFVEQKTLGKDKALKHFLEEYDDEYFSFCINTLDIIKSNNKIGNSEEIKWFREQTRNKSKLKQCYYHNFITNKIDILLSFICCIICMILCVTLFDFSFRVFNSTLGFMLICLYLIMFTFGLLETENI